MLQTNEESLLALIGGSIGVRTFFVYVGQVGFFTCDSIHPRTDHATGTVTQDIEMELWQISTIPILCWSQHSKSVVVSMRLGTVDSSWGKKHGTE